MPGAVGLFPYGAEEEDLRPDQNHNPVNTTGIINLYIYLFNFLTWPSGWNCSEHSSHCCYVNRLAGVSQ